MSDHAETPNAPDHPASSGDAHAPNAAHTAGHEPVVHPHEGHAAEPQEEGLPIGKVVMVATVSILIFAIGGVWAMKLRSATLLSMNPSGAPALPASMGAEEQGMVDQIPFELNHWVKDDRAASRKQMAGDPDSTSETARRGYGWVDQKAGIIHIPIERAIELQLSSPLTDPTKPPFEEPAYQPRPVEPKK